MNNKHTEFTAYWISMAAVVFAFVLLFVLVMQAAAQSTPVDKCAFADVWAGRNPETGSYPVGIEPFDYRVENGRWNFPEGVTWLPDENVFMANGGIALFGYPDRIDHLAALKAEYGIIVDPDVYLAMKARENALNARFAMIFCTLEYDAEASGGVPGNHNIKVYKIS